MPPLGPRTQTKATRQAQAKAVTKRNQNLVKVKAHTRAAPKPKAPTPRPRGQSRTQAPSLTPKQKVEDRRTAAKLGQPILPPKQAAKVIRKGSARPLIPMGVLRGNAPDFVKLKDVQRVAKPGENPTYRAKSLVPLPGFLKHTVPLSRISGERSGQGTVIYKKGTSGRKAQEQAGESEATRIQLANKGSAGVAGYLTTPPDTSKITSGLGKSLPANLLREAVDIPAQLPSSGYLAGKELVTKGPAKFAKDYARSTEEVLKHPKQHPLSAALTLLGAKAAVGRTLGAAGRAAGVEAAGTERPNLRLYPEGLGGPEKRRSYSRDVTNKAVQKAGEKVKEKVLKRDPNLAYPRPSLNPIRHGAPVRKHVLRRVDETVFAQEHLRRAERGGASKDVHETIPKDHRGALAYLIADNTVRSPETLVADLTKRQKALETVAKTEAKSFTHAEKKQNLAERSSIDAILADHEIMSNPKPLFASVEKFGETEAERQARLKELGQLGESGASEKPYAVSHLGARPVGRAKVLSVPRGPEDRFDVTASEKALARRIRQGKPAGSLRFTPKREGTGSMVPKRSEFRPVSTAEIKAARKAENVKDPIFLSQKNRGNAHYVPTIRGSGPPILSSKRRTGLATVRGTRDVSRGAMENQAIGSQGHISAVENFFRTANEFGIKPGGKFGTSYDKTQQIGDELVTHPPGHPQEGRLKPGHVRLVPMNVAKIRELKEKLDQVHENLGGVHVPEGEVLQSLSEVLTRAFDRPEGGGGRFILVPEDVAQRLKAHQFQAGDMEKLLQKAATHWKNVTLTTSAPTKWMTGNVVDLGIRDAAYGLGPVSHTRGRKILDTAERLEAKGEIPKGSAKYYESRITPGGFYSASHQMETHRPLPGGGSRPAKLLGEAWRKYYQTVYNAEGVLERQPQIAALGRVAGQDVKRSYDSISGFFKLGDRQIEDFVRGHINPDDASHAAEYVDQVVGRWGKVSPDARRFLMSQGPFVQWLRVALKFVFVTLPVHHPIKTAIAAGLYNMTDEERRKLGLTLFPAPGAPELKNYLQGSLPGVGGKLIRFGGFSSFGMVSQGTSGLTGFVYPQFDGAVKALNGLTWSNDQLVNPDGTPLSEGQKAAFAAYLIAEGMTPFASGAKRVLEKGGAEAPTSMVFRPRVFPNSKQGNLLSGLNRWANPARPTNPSYVQGHPAGGGGADPGSLPSVDQILQDSGAQKTPSVDDILKAAGVH